MSDTEASPAVAPLPAVLGALQDPIRLEVVRRLANAGTPLRCSLTYDGISKSTAAHHFKILRDAGVTDRVTIDGNIHLRLRTADLETAMPGLLAAVLAAANLESDDAPADSRKHFVNREQSAAESADGDPVAFRADRDAASESADGDPVAFRADRDAASDRDQPGRSRH